jgi:hypothetical protein
MDVFSDDVVVFIQKMEGTCLKKIMEMMPLSNVLHSYFFLQTCFQRAIQAHEKQNGRPSAVVVVLDLQGLNLTDFINPLSSSSKLARLVVKIWSDYFSENVSFEYGNKFNAYLDDSSIPNPSTRNFISNVANYEAHRGRKNSIATRICDQTRRYIQVSSKRGRIRI